MVRVKTYGWGKKWIVDDGDYKNGRLVDSIRTNGKVEASLEDGWLVLPDTYLSFVGNHAIIHSNPTPITKALNEVPLRGVEDGS